MEIERVLITLIKIFDDASISEIREDQVKKDILSGDLDLLFDNIDMDSLACMEICIGIELEIGTTLTPYELLETGSLQNVAKMITSRC